MWFQSAPPVETRGDIVAALSPHVVFSVSIRSPRRNEGRQSRHCVSVACQPGSFNPLPPSKRGETHMGRLFAVHLRVSIRSPRRNEGRLVAYTAAADEYVEFQSAPPVETRGDARRCVNPPASSLGFNPLPPSKRGETKVPIPLLFPSEVSIRSPRRNEGRPRALRPMSKHHKFQSAPPVETRGDAFDTNEGQSPQAVSIRSPRRNEGRPWASSAAVVGMASFNPLPPSKRGETHHRRAGDEGIHVSIRSPRRNEGRLVHTLQSYPLPQMFQSAPPVETRGDANIREMTSDIKSFNPLPPSKRGETLVAVTSGISKGCTSGCADLLPSASYCQSESVCLAVTYCYP